MAYCKMRNSRYCPGIPDALFLNAKDFIAIIMPILLDFQRLQNLASYVSSSLAQERSI